MKLLAIDTSTAVLSVAIGDENGVIHTKYLDNGLTHSQTLLTLVDDLLNESKLSINNINKLVVANGPGSFTGIRIGMSFVKGLAFANNIPCVPLSSMIGIANSVENGIIYPVIDCRRERFYNAVFEKKNRILTRLCDDRIISKEDIILEIQNIKSNVFVCGEKAVSFCDNVVLLPRDILYHTSEALLNYSIEFNIQGMSAKDIVPEYLQLTQAEQEMYERGEDHDSNCQ